MIVQVMIEIDNWNLFKLDTWERDILSQNVGEHLRYSLHDDDDDDNNDDNDKYDL